MPTPPPLPTATQLAPCAAFRSAESTGQSAIASLPSSIPSVSRRRRRDRGRIHVVASERQRPARRPSGRVRSAQRRPRRARRGPSQQMRAGRPCGGTRSRASSIQERSESVPTTSMRASSLLRRSSGSPLRQIQRNGPTPRAKIGAHVRGDEPRDRSRASSTPCGDGLRAEAVSVLEDDRAACAEAEHRLDVRGERVEDRARGTAGSSVGPPRPVPPQSPAAHSP